MRHNTNKCIRNQKRAHANNKIHFIPFFNLLCTIRLCICVSSHYGRNATITDVPLKKVQHWGRGSTVLMASGKVTDDMPDA